MKKLITLIIVLLFASPVIAFDFPKMKDPFQQKRLRLQQYTQQSAMERERQRQAQELIILQKAKERKQQRQIQEIIDNQRRMIDLQEKIERDNIWR